MTTIRLISLVAAGLALSSAAGCAAGASAGAEGSAQAPGTSRVRTNVLARADMESQSGQNLYETIRRLRPQWLVVRGGRTLDGVTEIVVFQDNTLIGNTEALRQMQTDMAVTVEYMDASTATNALPGLGSRRVAGAIIVRTR
jgi:hypothetical protein